jgi:hypothetical protein
MCFERLLGSVVAQRTDPGSSIADEWEAKREGFSPWRIEMAGCGRLEVMFAGGAAKIEAHAC